MATSREWGYKIYINRYSYFTALPLQWWWWFRSSSSSNSSRSISTSLSSLKSLIKGWLFFKWKWSKSNAFWANIVTNLSFCLNPNCSYFFIYFLLKTHIFPPKFYKNIPPAWMESWDPTRWDLPLTREDRRQTKTTMVKLFKESFRDALKEGGIILLCKDLRQGY